MPQNGSLQEPCLRFAATLHRSMSHADLSERPRRERDPLKGRRRALGFASALAAAVLLYAAFGFLLAPPLIERYLPQRLEAALGQPVALGTVSVNPFTFVVRARDVRIGGRDGDAPIALGALLLDFDPFASGFGRGWVLGDVRVDGARIRAQLDRAGRLDLAQLLAGRGEARGGGKPPRVVLRHVLVDAAVELRVVSGEKPEAIGKQTK